jgi:hypothetical protein
MAFLLPIAGAAGGVAGAAGGLGSILGFAGTILSAVGSMQQAKAQQRASEYNAKMAEVEAAGERDAASAEADDYRRKQRGARAGAIAERAASGVQLSGTPLLIDEDILGEIDLGAARIGHQGQTRATGLENEAKLEKAKAKNYGQAGKLSMLTGFAKAGSSLLGGARSFS